MGNLSRAGLEDGNTQGTGREGAAKLARSTTVRSAGYLTITVPRIFGWMVQMYW